MYIGTNVMSDDSSKNYLSRESLQYVTMDAQCIYFQSEQHFLVISQMNTFNQRGGTNQFKQLLSLALKARLTDFS